MSANPKTIINDCRALFEGLDSNSQAEVSAQLFLDYCVYQDQCENIRRLAPLVNTVAEALSKNVKGENSLHPGTPESFNVLVKELQSLCLDLKLEKKERS